MKKNLSVGLSFIFLSIFFFVMFGILHSALSDLAFTLLFFGIVSIIAGGIFCVLSFSKNSNEYSNQTSNTITFQNQNNAEDEALNYRLEMVNYNNLFSENASKIEHEILIDFSKHNWDSIQEKISELNALEIKTNHNRLILHFTYQNIVIAVYPMRDEDENITKIILYLCDLDIENMSHVYEPSIPQLLITRKAIILEKQNRLQEAIDLCQYAIDHEILDSKKPFNIRKNRLEKKLQQQKNEGMSKTN